MIVANNASALQYYIPQMKGLPAQWKFAESRTPITIALIFQTRSSTRRIRCFGRRSVSGVMSVARTSKAAARLSASFRTRHGVEKIYHAVVAGKLTGSGTREDFLVSRGGSGALERTDGRGPRTVIYRSMPPPIETRAVMPKGSGYGDEFSTADEGNTSPQPDRCQARPPEAKRAVLEWAAIDLPSPGARIPRCPRSGSPLTLVRVRLVTGRKHQIRVQLAGMGCPVVGDVRYGRFRGEGGTYAGSVPLEDRSILLHASGLVIPHPTRPGETVRVVAPPPKAWINLCGKEIIDVVLADARR